MSGASSEGTAGTTTVRHEQLHGRRLGRGHPADQRGVLQHPRRQHAVDHRARPERRHVPRRRRVLRQLQRQRARSTPYQYSAYAGYWPIDPAARRRPQRRAVLRHRRRTCTPSSTAAHANNLKVLFDYAMVDVLTRRAPSYTNNPSWFTTDCQCGAAAGCGDYNDYTCWFTPYLAHFNFTEHGRVRAPRGPTRSTARCSSCRPTATTPSASTRSSRWTRAGSRRCGRRSPRTRPRSPTAGRCSTSTWSARRTTSRTRGYIASFINPTTAPRRAVRLPAPLPARRRHARARHGAAARLLHHVAQQPERPELLVELHRTRRACRGSRSSWIRTTRSTPAYAPGAVMSTFIGNQDLPRSIHFAEDDDAVVARDGRQRRDAIQNAVTYNGEYTPSTEAERDVDAGAGDGDRSEHLRATRERLRGHPHDQGGAAHLLRRRDWPRPARAIRTTGARCRGRRRLRLAELAARRLDDVPRAGADLPARPPRSHRDAHAHPREPSGDAARYADRDLRDTIRTSGSSPRRRPSGRRRTRCTWRSTGATPQQARRSGVPAGLPGARRRGSDVDRKRHDPGARDADLQQLRCAGRGCRARTGAGPSRARRR